MTDTLCRPQRGCFCLLALPQRCHLPSLKRFLLHRSGWVYKRFLPLHLSLCFCWKKSPHHTSWLDGGYCPTQTTSATPLWLWGNSPRSPTPPKGSDSEPPHLGARSETSVGEEAGPRTGSDVEWWLEGRTESGAYIGSPSSKFTAILCLSGWTAYILERTGADRKKGGQPVLAEHRYQNPSFWFLNLNSNPLCVTSYWVCFRTGSTSSGAVFRHSEEGTCTSGEDPAPHCPIFQVSGLWNIVQVKSCFFLLVPTGQTSQFPGPDGHGRPTWSAVRWPHDCWWAAATHEAAPEGAGSRASENHKSALLLGRAARCCMSPPPCPAPSTTTAATLACSSSLHFDLAGDVNRTGQAKVGAGANDWGNIRQICDWYCAGCLCCPLMEAHWHILNVDNWKEKWVPFHCPPCFRNRKSTRVQSKDFYFSNGGIFST